MTCGIYKITNKINNKTYVGLSTNIERRWFHHKRKMNSKDEYDKALYRAFRKHGLDKFEFSIIEECEVNSLRDREVFWISELKSFDREFGYNLTLGGDCGAFNKLNQNMLCEIIELLSNTTMSNTNIGELFGISDQMISDINRGRSWHNPKIKYPIREQKCATLNFCVDCGKEISTTKGTTRCVDCNNIKLRKIERPNKDILVNQLRAYGFKGVGNMYGVSDNAVRKWCTCYGLPRDIRSIKLI